MSPSIQALAGQMSGLVATICSGSLVSQHIHSHGTGPLLYFRVTCPYSLSSAALLVCCEVNKLGLLSRGAQSTHFPRLLPRSLPRWSSSSCFVTAAVFLVSMRES
jgi:hypothetical protein